jgi:hypothetical protein
MDTFVVRVWSPGADDGPEGVRGTAMHLSSGTTITFTEPGALIRFLTAERGDGEPGARRQTRSTPPNAEC